MRKRVMNTFRYRDCDAFAEYLHRQSLQGWHFKEWRFGLVFEKGEPADINYVVEVFPNGAEMDTRPERQAQEYAEYCETAGWKLLDSSRKFCIFRRMKESAVPIVEPEERFKNIRRAEWIFWLRRCIPILLVSGIQWLQMLSLNFKNLIFSDLMLLTLLFMTLVSVQMLSEGICLLYWSFTRHRLLKSGKIPLYGRKGHLDTRAFPLLLYVLFVGFLVYRQEQTALPILLPTAVTLFLLMLIGAVIAFWRPSRADNWIFQIASAGVVLILCFAFTAAILFSGPDPDYVSKDAEAFPLVQADYQIMEGEILSVNEDHIEGILGSADRFYIDYDKKAILHNEPENEPETDSLWYTIYQSRYPWILDRLWNGELPDSKESYQERTKAWNALSAVSQGGTGRTYKELVRYPDRLLVLYSDEKLEDSQIEIIRQRLCEFK